MTFKRMAETNVFNLLLLGKSRFPHKKFHNINYLLEGLNVNHLDKLLVFSGLLEAAPDRGLHIAATECGELTEYPRDLDAVVEEET